MYYSVDRFEENLAILQDDGGNSIPVLKTLLPKDVKQGDVLVLKDGRYFYDFTETNRRREYIQKLQKQLFGEDK